MVATHHSSGIPPSGIPPSRTAVVLRDQDDSLPLCRRDIYNLNVVLSRAKRKGGSPPEALVTHLESEKDASVFFKYRRDEAGHIATLFVADLRSVKYLNQHPDISFQTVHTRLTHSIYLFSMFLGLIIWPWETRSLLAFVSLIKRLKRTTTKLSSS
jgi:hypothetical protein